jgi:hypothetical protein
MLGKGSEENKSLNVVSVIVVVAEDKSSNIWMNKLLLSTVDWELIKS